VDRRTNGRTDGRTDRQTHASDDSEDFRARRLTCFISVSATRKGLQFAHEQTPLSSDTIDTVLRHRDVGRAKDLPESLRNDRIVNWLSTGTLRNQGFHWQTNNFLN
jgi:hypothetical protein